MIIFSDLHLRPESRDECFEVLRRIPQVCRELDDHHVAFLGDFWMVRHTLNVKLLLECRDELCLWAGNGVERFDVIPGNHDQINTEGRNALEVFADLPLATHVHNEPTWTGDGLWIPYRANLDDVRAALASERPTGSAKVCFAHVAVKGAMMNNLKADSAGIDAAELKENFSRVFLGHYHKPHTVRKGVTYIGSPYQVNYAEAGQPKGFVHWDGKRAKFHEWDPVIGKRHHKIEIDADHPEEVSLDGIAEGDKLWVLVKGTMAGTMRDVVADQLAKSGVDVERLEVDMQPTTEGARIVRRGGETMTDLARGYVDGQDVDDAFKSLLHSAWNRISP